jgi:hypothetical protein
MRVCTSSNLFYSISRFLVVVQYISMYSEIGSKSNTMIFSERPGDVNALLAQAAAVVSGSFKAGASASTSSDQGLSLSQQSSAPEAPVSSGTGIVESESVAGVESSNATALKSDGR